MIAHPYRLQKAQYRLARWAASEWEAFRADDGLAAGVIEKASKDGIAAVADRASGRLERLEHNIVKTERPPGIEIDPRSLPEHPRRAFP